MKYYIYFLIIKNIISQLYNIKSINYYDTSTSLNLLFQGSSKISLLEYENYENECDLTKALIEKEDNDLNIKLYSQEIPIGIQSNRNYILFSGFRIDYYLTGEITNNPNTIDSDFFFECSDANPYNCEYKNTYQIICISGLLVNIVHLNQLIDFSNGFNFYFEFLYYPSNHFHIIFHEFSINDYYTYSLLDSNLSFLNNAFYLDVDTTNNIIHIYLINSSTITLLISLYLNKFYLNGKNNINIVYSSEKREECFYSYSILNCDEFNNIIKIYVNSNLYYCFCDSNIESNILSKEGYITFHNSNSDPSNPMLLISLYLKLENLKESISSTFYCDTQNIYDKSLTLKNISPFTEEKIYLSYNYSSLTPTNITYICFSESEQYYLIPSSNQYIIYYNSKEIDNIFINSIHLSSTKINDIYPLKKNYIFYPDDLYNLCIYYTFSKKNSGYCSCDICTKSLLLSVAYFQEKPCISNYMDKCYCFDTNNNHKRNDLCKECYDTIKTCKLNNKKSTCKSNKCICDPDNSNYNSLTETIYSGIKNNLSYIPKFLLSCINCLYDTTKTELDCESICEIYKTENIYLNHYPSAGYQCTSCILSSEYLQALKQINKKNYNKILNCIIDNSNSFYHSCIPIITKLNYQANQIFSGLITHFKVECPSKNFNDYGSICIPFYGFNAISEFTLIYKKTSNNKQWEDKYQCLNENCENVSKDDCSNNNYICVCYDSCPYGKNYFFNEIEIPCSGRGTCTKDGICICDYGFVGNNCEKHCSESACCEEDNDCIYNGFTQCVGINTFTGLGYCI